MRRFLALVLLGTLLGACTLQSPRRRVVIGPRRGGGQQAASQNGGTAQAPEGGVSEQPMDALNQVASFLGQYGYSPAGPAVRNTNMGAGQLMAYAIDAQAGTCYVALAVGEQGTDLDIVVLDPMGRSIGHDVQPDTHPHVGFCANQTGRHIARLQMASGTGEYYYLVLSGPRQVNAELATFFDQGQDQEQTATTTTSELDTGTRNRLASLDQRLGRQRYTRIQEPTGVVMDQRETRDFQLSLQEGYCYAFATLGGEGTSDTDVYIVDMNGNEIERDTAVDLDAVVEFCPPNDGAYQLRSRLYSGQGPVYIAGWVRPQQPQATQVATEVTEGVIAQESTAGAGLEENFRLLNADMQARGYESYGDTSRGELGENQSREFAIELEGGKCYAVLAVGDNGVRDLDLIIRDRSGNLVDRDIEADARPIVRVCPESDGEQEIEVRMANGQGNFVYAAYRWPRGTRGPFGLSGLIYVRLGEVTQLLNVEGYEPSMDFSPERGSLRRQGANRSHRLTLPPNRCFSILVVGGDGVNDLDVRLTHGNEQVAADTTRNAFPDLRFCTQQGGRYHLVVNAANGSGDYFYQIFERSES